MPRHIMNNAEKFEAGIKSGCLPPTKPAVKQARFTIPAGTALDIQDLREWEWQPYTTKQQLSFERFEKYDAEFKCYQFRFQGFLIMVHRSKVKHREDSY